MRAIRFIAGMASAVILANILPIAISADDAVNTNVALNKTVTTNVVLDSQDSANQWGAERLVDGNTGTMSLVQGSSDNEYFQVDLGKSYDITKVELYDRVDQEQVAEGRFGFRIIASNTADFSDYDILGGLDMQDDTRFPAQGCYTINENGTEKYRYVRFERTEKRTGWWLFYSELKIFADVEVTMNVDMSEREKTNVSFGKTATASDWYDKANDPSGENNFAPSNLLDDTISANDRWLSYYGEQGQLGYTYLIVDLETPRHVGYVELENVPNSGTDIANFYSNFSLYLANEYDEDVLFNNRLLTGQTGYKEIAVIGENAENLWINGKLNVKCDDTEAYRYLIYKRTSGRPEKPCFSELGAIRVYELNPMLDDVTVSGNEIIFKFNEDMNAETVNSDSVKIYSGEQELSCTITDVDTKTYKAVLPQQVFDNEIKVQISDAAKNAKGVSVKSGTEKTVLAPAAVEAEEFAITALKDGTGTEISSLEGLTEVGARIKVKNNQQSAPDSAAAIMLLLDENNTVISIDSEMVDIAALAEETITLGVDIPSGDGYKLKVFLWRNFSMMKMIEPHKTVN